MSDNNNILIVGLPTAVGQMVSIVTADGDQVKATWLGEVSNGKELAEAMRTMERISDWRNRVTSRMAAELEHGENGNDPTTG